MAINFDQDRAGLINLSRNIDNNQMAFVPNFLKNIFTGNPEDIQLGEEGSPLDKAKDALEKNKQKSLPTPEEIEGKTSFLNLPSNNLTATAISNYDQLFGPQTVTDAFGVNRSTLGLDRPDINTGKFNVNEVLPNDGITKNVRFRDMLLQDLKNLPSDFKTSLGTVKEGLAEDFSGLKDFATNLKDQGIDLGSLAISGIGNAIAPGVGFALNALAKASGPNYRAMIEKDLAEKGFTVDSTGKIVQTGDYATPQNIMAGYNLAAPGITASAFNRYDKIREGIKKGIFKDKIRAQQKLDALGQFALEKERARKAAYDKAIQDAKNAERREQARIDSITAGYGGADESPGATGPTAAGAGMGVGGGYASDFGYDFAKGGIASL